MKARTLITVVALAFVSVGQIAVAHDIKGKVTLGGQPVSGAAVTLWQTAATQSEVAGHGHDQRDRRFFDP